MMIYDDMMQCHLAGDGACDDHGRDFNDDDDKWVGTVGVSWVNTMRNTMMSSVGLMQI